MVSYFSQDRYLFSQCRFAAYRKSDYSTAKHFEAVLETIKILGVVPMKTLASPLLYTVHDIPY